jgi:hypothetical protein
MFFVCICVILYLILATDTKNNRHRTFFRRWWWQKLHHHPFYTHHTVNGLWNTKLNNSIRISIFKIRSWLIPTLTSNHSHRPLQRWFDNAFLSFTETQPQQQLLHVYGQYFINTYFSFFLIFKSFTSRHLFLQVTYLINQTMKNDQCNIHTRRYQWKSGDIRSPFNNLYVSRHTHQK